MKKLTIVAMILVMLSASACANVKVNSPDHQPGSQTQLKDGAAAPQVGDATAGSVFAGQTLVGLPVENIDKNVNGFPVKGTVAGDKSLVGSAQRVIGLEATLKAAQKVHGQELTAVVKAAPAEVREKLFGAGKIANLQKNQKVQAKAEAEAAANGFGSTSE